SDDSARAEPMLEHTSVVDEHETVCGRIAHPPGMSSGIPNWVTLTQKTRSSKAIGNRFQRDSLRNLWGVAIAALGLTQPATMTRGHGAGPSRGLYGTRAPSGGRS